MTDRITVDTIKSLSGVRELAAPPGTTLADLLANLNKGDRLACWRPERLNAQMGTLIFHQIEILNALLGTHIDPLPCHFFSIPEKGINRFMD